MALYGYKKKTKPAPWLSVPGAKPVPTKVKEKPSPVLKWLRKPGNAVRFLKAAAGIAIDQAHMKAGLKSIKPVPQSQYKGVKIKWKPIPKKTMDRLRALNPPQRRKRIRPVSARQRKLNALYSPLAAQYKRDNPFCRCCPVARPGQPPNPTEDVHHKKGRGKYLLVTETWLPVCRECHNRIGENPQWAYANGMLERRGK